MSSQFRLASPRVVSPMRVGMLAPISWRVPPRNYGPGEQIVSLLTEGLIERGIDVTLFATADSVTKARLVSVCPRAYSEDPAIDVKVWESLHISAAFERAGEFDLIHNHFDFLPLTYSQLTQAPGNFYQDPAGNLRRLYRRFRECYLKQEAQCFR